MKIQDSKYYALTEYAKIDEHIVSAEDEFDLQEVLVDIEASYYKSGPSAILVSEENLNNLIKEISRIKDIKLCKCNKC